MTGSWAIALVYPLPIVIARVHAFHLDEQSVHGTQVVGPCSDRFGATYPASLIAGATIIAVILVFVAVRIGIVAVCHDCRQEESSSKAHSNESRPGEFHVEGWKGCSAFLDTGTVFECLTTMKQSDVLTES